MGGKYTAAAVGAEPIFAEAMVMEAIYGAGSQHALPPPVHVFERVVREFDGAAHRRRELCSVWTFDGNNILSI